MAVSLTFGATTSGTTTGSSITFSGIAIGAAAVDRFVFAVVTKQLDGTFSSCSIGGVTATKFGEVTVAGATPDLVAAIFGAYVPTGTTTNIIVNVSAGDGRVGISTIRMVGGSPLASDTDQLTGSGISISISGLTIPTNGGAVLGWVNDANATAVTWTNASEVSDANYNPHRHSAAITTTAGTPTITADGATAQQGIIGFAFREGVLLSPALLDDGEILYAPTLIKGVRTVSPALYSDADAVYATTVTQETRLFAGLYSDPDTFFTPVIDLPLNHSHIHVSWFSIQSAVSLDRHLDLVLYSDADTFYAPSVSAANAITAQRINDGDLFFSPSVHAQSTLSPALYSDADTFFAPTVSTGAVTLSPQLYTDADTFFAPTVVRSALTLTVPLFTDEDTFFAPTIQPGAVTLTASRYDDADTFFAPRVQRAIGAQLYSDADSFFSPTVTRGARTLTAARFDDADIIFSASFAAAGTDLVPGRYNDPDTFYTPTIFWTVHPALYSDADTFFAPTMQAGAVAITASLYADPDTFFTTAVLQEGDIFVDAIYQDPDTFPAPSIVRGAVTIAPARYNDRDVFYGVVISRQRVATNIRGDRGPAKHEAPSRGATPGISRRETPSISRRAA